jgi:hypothetical protein
LSDLQTSVTALYEILKNFETANWSRLSSHESGGNELTLQVWVERSLAHIEEHLREVKKIT